MKRFYNLITLFVLLFATLLLTSLSASATMMSAPTGCAPAELQGTYAFFASPTVVIDQGTVVAIPDALLVTSPVMLASRGTVQFDGQDQVVLTATQDSNGAVMNATEYMGNYTITAGCNATITLANGLWFTVRVVKANDQPQVVSTTPGFILIPNR